MTVFTERGFLSPAQCAAIQRGMDAGDVEQAEILDRGIHREAHIRVATLVEPALNLIRDVETTLDACRDRVAAALGTALAEREGAGFIRYPAGGFYRPHTDRGDDAEWEGASRRAVALVV